MNKKKIEIIIEILEKESKKWNVPVVNLIALQSKNPFKILLSTIISLRTKDEVTIKSSVNLYKLLPKPEDISKITINQIENAIYPCAFYKRKAIQLKEICERLVTEFNSEIPSNIETLLSFKGVGRKTANLILAEGFQIPAICVDTHVHRISNRLNIVKTKTPEETEFDLKKKLPKKYWIKYNSLFVSFGQSICRPISPYCSKCPISKYCLKLGVKYHR